MLCDVSVGMCQPVQLMICWRLSCTNISRRQSTHKRESEEKTNSTALALAVLIGAMTTESFYSVK